MFLRPRRVAPNVAAASMVSYLRKVSHSCPAVQSKATRRRVCIVVHSLENFPPRGRGAAMYWCLDVGTSYYQPRAGALLSIQHLERTNRTRFLFSFSPLTEGLSPSSRRHPQGSRNYHYTYTRTHARAAHTHARRAVHFAGGGCR